MVDLSKNILVQGYKKKKKKKNSYFHRPS